MVEALARFNFVLPGLDPRTLSDMHRAALDMAEYADEHGFAGFTLEEHHGAPNGWSPTPLLTAGMVFARTKRLSVTISALLLPLHDPVRIAEDIAVLDLASRGRLNVVAGLGYRPSEYVLHGKDWSQRGALMDECLDTMLKAWTGEPFEYHGATVQVTPKPLTQPHPVLLLGGTSKAAARRAARFGLPFFPARSMPALAAYYDEQCRAFGTQGFCTMPDERFASIHVAKDPERAWRDLGHHFLHEATTYASWQTEEQSSAVHSNATTVPELRAEGIYQVLTPEECIQRGRAQGANAWFNLHPLCGGMPIDEAWSSMRLFVEEVLPELS